MKELKSVTNMLGTMLTKEEVHEFMAEADKVKIVQILSFIHYVVNTFSLFRMGMASLTMMSL